MSDMPTAEQAILASARRKSRGPILLVQAAIETHQPRVPIESGKRWLTGQAVWATSSRRREGGWSKETDPERWDCLHFWEWVAAMALGRTRVWIMAYRADEFLNLSRFWEAVELDIVSLKDRPDTIRKSEETKKKQTHNWVGAFVLGQRTTMMEGVGHKGRFLVCSTANYLQCDTVEVCDAVGITVPKQDQPGETGSAPILTPRVECQAWHRWFRETIQSYVSRGLGNWLPTAATMSVSIWHKTDGKRAARRHHNKDAKQLEAGALHGGRGQVWYYGHVGPYLPLMHQQSPYPAESAYPSLEGPAYKYDVTAQYPALLRDMVFPVQLGGFWHAPSIDQIRAWSRIECCIASVRIRTGKAEYPRKTARGTDYPIGEFCTVLAGPELLLAIDSGCVLHCYAAARYIPGEPFRGWAKAVLQWREECKQDGDKLGNWFAKTVGNSFSGKFAQRQKLWMDRPQLTALCQWGEFPLTVAGTGRTRRIRAVAGRCREMVTELPGHRLPAAVYAYLTAYGRLQMRRLREQLPERTVLYQCTDSVIVTQAGQEQLSRSKSLIGSEPGLLKFEYPIESLRMYGPNHWWADGTWTLAGVPAGWWSDGRTTIRSLHRSNPATMGAKTRPDYVAEEVREEPLCDIPFDTVVGQDGWLVNPNAHAPSEFILPPFSPGWTPDLFSAFD